MQALYRLMETIYLIRFLLMYLHNIDEVAQLCKTKMTPMKRIRSFLTLYKFKGMDGTQRYMTELKRTRTLKGTLCCFK